MDSCNYHSPRANSRISNHLLRGELRKVSADISISEGGGNAGVEHDNRTQILVALIIVSITVSAIG